MTLVHILLEQNICVNVSTGACSGKIAVLNGTKGEFGSNYDKDESCRWRIETGADQVRTAYVGAC